jgi:hypothetical protein
VTIERLLVIVVAVVVSGSLLGVVAPDPMFRDYFIYVVGIIFGSIITAALWVGRD